MKNLTDALAIKKIDPQNTLGSTELLAKQCQAAWEQVNALDIPKDLGNIENIVCCGMGASNYGAYVLKALLGSSMQYPMEVISDYHLPSYVKENTLVVLTSYSGSTEEVLSCAQEAKEKGAKMLVLTKGGKLAEFAKENTVPSYIFDGVLNPAGVPRLANGYSILGLMGLMHKAGIMHLSEQDVTAAITRLTQNIPEIKAKAMKDAEMFVGKIPVILAAEHLSGNALIFRNQFNETSKTFSAFYLVPDLNHHLMEGLQFPNPTPLQIIMINSSNYSKKIKRRMELTEDVVKKNNQPLYTYNTDLPTIYDDFLQVMVYGSYVTLYLGLIHDQNPATNPWVDYFKDQLTKTS